MKLTLRILTFICYFLPFTFLFTTCDGLDVKYAYNQKQADANVSLESKMSSTKQSVADTSLKTVSKTDTPKAIVASTSIAKDNVTSKEEVPVKSDDYWDGIFLKLIMPTDKSLSGIGAIFYYKNIIGKAAIAISLLISSIFLIGYKYLKSRRQKKYLLLGNVFCVIIFIADSLYSEVSLLWGTWVLIILLLLQIAIRLRGRKRTVYS